MSLRLGIAVLALVVLLNVKLNIASDAAESSDAILIKAVIDGDVAASRRLLAQRNAAGETWPVDRDGKSLLLLAIEGRAEDHPAIVELLIEKGADLEAKGAWGMTALHWAASRGYAERTEQILRHHPRIESTDDFGRTPLLVAHSGSAPKLLAAKANLLAMDHRGNSALHYAAESGAAHLGLLFGAGFTVIDVRNNAGLSPLHFATVAGNESACRWLLDHGANVNAVTAADYDYLPLDFAPGFGNEIRLRAGSTPLRIAAMRHQATKWSSGRFRPIVDLLKSRGATADFTSPALQLFFSLVAGTGAIVLLLGLFFIDARMTGWHTLAQRFAASAEPVTVNKYQDGGVGTVGLVRLRKLLRGRYRCWPLPGFSEIAQCRTSPAASSLGPAAHCF